MIRLPFFLWILALALLPTAVAQSASQPDTNVDFHAFVRELEQTTKEPGYLGILMWTPTEFWEQSAERAGFSAEKAHERYNALRKFIVIMAGLVYKGIG